MVQLRAVERVGRGNDDVGQQQRLQQTRSPAGWHSWPKLVQFRGRPPGWDHYRGMQRHLTRGRRALRSHAPVQRGRVSWPVEGGRPQRERWNPVRRVVGVAQGPPGPQRPCPSDRVGATQLQQDRLLRRTRRRRRTASAQIHTRLRQQRSRAVANVLRRDGRCSRKRLHNKRVHGRPVSCHSCGRLHPSS